MWDLPTIIRINHEAQRSFEEKDSAKACLEESIKRNEGIFDREKQVSGGVTYLRSVYEGDVDGCSSQSGSGETLP